MKALNFNDRLSYLAWRKEWKAAYKELSQNIRKAKVEFKDHQRKIIVKKRDTNWGPVYEAFYDDKPLYHCDEHYKQCGRLYRLRKDAGDMLMLLDEAKAKSREQRKAAMAVVTC